MIVIKVACRSGLENYTSNNTTQHNATSQYNMKQHKYNTTQHKATQVQHKTTQVQTDTARVQHSINFIFIYLHNCCMLGAWNIKVKVLLIF